MSKDAAAVGLQLPLFYIESVTHNDGTLTVRIGENSGPTGSIVFNRPASFWFFSESDHYDLLQT